MHSMHSILPLLLLQICSREEAQAAREALAAGLAERNFEEEKLAKWFSTPVGG